MVEVSQNIKAAAANFTVPVGTAGIGGVVGAGVSLATGSDVTLGVIFGNIIGSVTGFAVSEEIVSIVPAFENICAEDYRATHAGAMYGVGFVFAVTAGIGAAFIKPDISIEESANSETLESISSSNTPNEIYQMKLPNGYTLVSS